MQKQRRLLKPQVQKMMQIQASIFEMTVKSFLFFENTSRFRVSQGKSPALSSIFEHFTSKKIVPNIFSFPQDQQVQVSRRLWKMRSRYQR
jgi:hypothetical protein